MAADPTTDPRLRSWVEVAEGSDFPIQNLPYGIFERPGDTPRLGMAIGNKVFDVAGAAAAGLLADIAVDRSVFYSETLNSFIACGAPLWRQVRERVSSLLELSNPTVKDVPGLIERLLLPMSEVDLLVPIAPGDYVDFYSSLQHATNLGRLFRPDGDPLLPNWRHLPIGYHGRASSVVVSGTPIARPEGQLKTPDQPPHWGPTERLDIELEVGFITGGANALGQPIPIESAEEHIFGMVLVNDWSARDIQSWEYQPLGPFLGKSFATSIGPWVVSLDALEPYRVPAPPQDPAPLDYLRQETPRGLDIHLEAALATQAMPKAQVLSRVNFNGMYWTMAQQLAHITSNGTPVRAGDLYASGTVSGSDPGSYGSLIELTGGGATPITLASGEERRFLEDGDTAVIRGFAGGGNRPRIGLGEVRGTILPSTATTGTG